MSFRTIVPALCLVVALDYGCCKAYCIDTYLDLGFVGFSPDEADTVIITRYPAGSGFVNPIDSMLSEPGRFQGDTTSLFVSDNITLKDDYAIALPGAGKRYLLSGISTSRVHCSGCAKGQHHHVVTFYQLNGEIHPAEPGGKILLFH